MLNRQKRLLMTFTLLTLVCSPVRAFAFYPYTPTYKINTLNSKFIFVMLSPDSRDVELKMYNDEHKEFIRKIRNQYSRSGLYRNDGSNNPLWTVDGYYAGVKVASDGIHLVRYYRNATSVNEEAISFFANGVLIKTYKICELVDFPWILHQNVSHFEWIEKEHLDENNLQYSLTTKDGNQFTFDLQTGEIVSASHTERWQIVGSILGMILATCCMVWMIKRRRNQKSISFRMYEHEAIKNDFL